MFGLIFLYQLLLCYPLKRCKKMYYGLIFFKFKAILALHAVELLLKVKSLQTDIIFSQIYIYKFQRYSIIILAIYQYQKIQKSKLKKFMINLQQKVITKLILQAKSERTQKDNSKSLNSNCFMSLKITPEIFKWLQSISLIKQAKRNNDLLQISQDISQKFFDGNNIALILKNYFKHMLDDQSYKKLQILKENSNPAIRLYNWNILIEILKKTKISNLDSAEKSKIINLQPQPILKILKALHQVRQKPAHAQKKGLKVQISQIQKKTILQTNNSMQFLILALSKNFKLSPQHTLNLFIDSNKYLSHLLVKGVKNNFIPIYQFLADVQFNLDYLVSHIFCVDEEQNVNFFFNALKSCLISKDENTVWECLQLWTQIQLTYKMKNISIKHLKKWVKAEGINTLFFTLSKNSRFFQKIIQVSYQYLELQIFEFFQLSQKNLIWNNEKQKLNFFKKLITLENKQIGMKFLQSSYIQEWLKFFIKIHKKLKQPEQLNDMSVIFQNLWLLMQDKFEDENLNLINNYLQFIKQLLTTSNFVLFISTSISIFNLIKALGAKKNQNAPFLYRTAIAAFSNLTSTDELKITFYCQNFIISIKEIKNLPGTPLIPSIIKHLNSVPNSELIQLCKVLFTQKRLNEQESIEILQILTKIIFQDTSFSQMANQIVFDIIPSLNDQIADDYLLNNSKLCLSNFVSQAKNISKGLKQLKIQLENQKKTHQESQNLKGKQVLTNNFKKLLSCSNFINFLSKYLDIDDVNLRNSLETILFSTYVKVKVQLKKRKVADLLLPLMKRYYEQDEDLQNQISEYQKQNYPEQDPKEYSSKITLLKSIRLGKSVDLSSLDHSDLRTIDPSSLKPSTFAIKDLETLKQKREHLRTIQDLKQKQSVQAESKLKQIKNFINQKRFIQFGSAGKADCDYKNLYDFDSMKEEEVVPGVTMIKLINFQKQEQITHQQDLKSVMKKYRKVWRFLFFKYSTFGAKKQQFKTEEKIHMAEIWKMIKEYEVFSSLKKEQSQTIIKLINDMMKRKNDPQSLTYPGFEQYIAQLCCYSYNKFEYAHIPSGRQILLFIEQLKKSTRQKGGSTELFENPEDIYFQQTDVIRQYNKRLKQNPDYILPEGYKKYKQTYLQYEYNIHPMLQKNISSSYVDVFEILNQVLFSKLQLSLIQPLTIKNEINLVKPMLFQNITEKMKQYKKGYLQPKTTIQIADDKQKQLKKSIILKKQFHPHINFSLGIKLGLSSVSVKNKSIAEEVAYWMHDMLNAVQNQSLKVQNAAKKKIQNPIIKRRRAQSLQKLKKQRTQKKQWKKRTESLKVKFQIQKKLKDQEGSKKKEVQMEQKRKKRARQEQSLKRKLSRFQQMKKIMSDRKQEAKYKKIEQEDKRKQRLESYRQKVAEYFQKKKQQLIEKQEQLKKKKQLQEKVLQQQKQKQTKFVKQLYLSNLKKQQNVLQKAQQIKDKYEELWESDEIQKQLKKTEKQLLYLFNLLLKYQKSKISATSFDQIGLNTLHYFAVKFMVVPFMVQKTQLIKIFNFIIKEKQKRSLTQSNKKSISDNPVSPTKIKSPGLNFKNFQEALFLIVIKAKKMLDKINEKRKKRLQKLSDFVKQNKDENGNVNIEQMSSSSQEQSEEESEEQEKNPGLLDQYLFNVEDVDEQTLSQMFVFLKLPKDKAGVQERYRSAIQTKNLKPKNHLKTQLIKQMQTVKIEDILPQEDESQDQK